MKVNHTYTTKAIYAPWVENSHNQNQRSNKTINRSILTIKIGETKCNKPNSY